jgi:hypothetical protein
MRKPVAAALVGWIERAAPALLLTVGWKPVRSCERV